MGQELELAVQHMEEVNNVVLEFLKGKDATRIAKDLGMTRVKVMDCIQEWRMIASNSDAIRERARDALAGADMHFSSLIDKSYEVMDAADMTGNLRDKTNAIRLVKDIEAQRIELLQKAGLLNNQELAEDLANMERKYDAMKHILNRVLCSECKQKVVRELQGTVIDVD